VSLDEDRECELALVAAPAREPLQQLAVRQSADCPYVEQGADLTEDSSMPTDCHESTLLLPPDILNVV
jgi:hypothetical protein